MTPKQIVEIGGVFAVILSLLFLALEIRQSNSIAIASSENELRAAQRDRNLVLMESMELSSLVLKVRNNDELSPEEKIWLESYVSSIFQTWASAMQQYDNGVLSDYSLEVYLNNMRVFIRVHPGALEFLASIRDDYELFDGVNVMWDTLNYELELRGY